jgi:uncharacterized protein YkwD
LLGLFHRATCAALLAAAVGASAASAETVRVVNDRGRGQAQVQITANGAKSLTDAQAQTAVNVGAGSAVSGDASRWLQSLCGTTPDQAFSFAATGGLTTLTIPSITPDVFDASLSAEENKLISLVNNERVAGRSGDFAHPSVPAMTDIAPLDRAADTQAAWVNVDAQHRLTHCGYNGYGPGLRAQDEGYTGPGNGTGEVLVIGQGITADGAFNSWMHSPSHWSILMSSSMTTMGTAITPTAAVIVTGVSCAGASPPSATPS